MAPTDQDYGSRDFVAKDPEGNVWCFGTFHPGGRPRPEQAAGGQAGR